VLDVVMNDDKNRARKDHAPENLATLRRLALTILRAHPTAIRCAAKSSVLD
jgi:predicted transposase YbfD/YdcC